MLSIVMILVASVSRVRLALLLYNMHTVWKLTYVSLFSCVCVF